VEWGDQATHNILMAVPQGRDPVVVKCTHHFEVAFDDTGTGVVRVVCVGFDVFGLRTSLLRELEQALRSGQLQGSADLSGEDLNAYFVTAWQNGNSSTVAVNGDPRRAFPADRKCSTSVVVEALQKEYLRSREPQRGAHGEADR
jgi:hypothetical protein